MNDKLHFWLHDKWGYLTFLLHIPFHLHHKSEGYPNYDYFTLKGSILCKCGYHYDKGYYLMNCLRCYVYDEKRVKELQSKVSGVEECNKN